MGSEEKTVKQMTEANLKSAYADETQANMRYTIYAKKAREEGSKCCQTVHSSGLCRTGTRVQPLIMSLGGSVTVSTAAFGPRNTSENL